MLFMATCLSQINTCNTLGNSYLKYTHFDQVIQKEQDKFVNDHRTLVGIGGSVYIITQRHVAFPLVSGLIVDMNVIPKQESLSFNFNWGF